MQSLPSRNESGLSLAIKEARHAKGYSQAELGSLVGVNPRKIQAYESAGRDRQVPMPVVYEALNRVLFNNQPVQAVPSDQAITAFDDLEQPKSDLSKASIGDLIEELKRRGYDKITLQSGKSVLVSQ